GPTRTLRELGAVLENPDFLVLFIGLLIFAGVGGTSGALALYLQTYFWGLTSEDLKWFGFLALGAVAAFLVLGRIERRLDKKTIMLVSFGLLLVDGFTLIGLRLLGLLPANGDPALLVILVGNGVWTTFIGTILGITVVSMLADTLDSQELRTGLRQEGIFAAALAFSGKATHGVGAVIGGLLLQKVIGWPTHADPRTVDPALVTRLGVVAGVVVPLFFLAPLAIGTRYRITRDAFRTIRAELDRRREAQAAVMEARMSATPPIA
nr:MFS transporter [Caulobacteraceae bacterium]